MRFYVPEWDDAVDAGYDFEHDEFSSIDRDERELSYIWDIFDRETTPIDGVLISREKVEESRNKTARLRDHGVYDDPVLSIPEYLPTISDCGAWGYKWLPFPPYGNREMLEFYEEMDVSVGVTIDHLVLGSGKELGRLYLDERALGEGITEADIPDTLTDVVELKIEQWPDEWPSYVSEYEPSVCTPAGATVEPFGPDIFEGDLDEILDRLKDDPRAVYRTDDKQFRYDLTLRNAEEMYDLYQSEDYPFRLMVAIQGWNADNYVAATERVLDIGYQYVGIGGVAGSPIHEVRNIVKEVGKTVKDFERTYDTRVDTHVFGFAKAEAFESIGRSGMASFDSASMLRGAWTGGGNYRLDDDERYDAIRVRYPPHGADVDVAIEYGLKARETLVALQAYSASDSIPDALREWRVTAEQTLNALHEYLRTYRHDDTYDVPHIQTVETRFRDDFEFARELTASFSRDMRRALAKLLRSDDPDEPLNFAQYEEIIATAREHLYQFPRSSCLFDPSVGPAVTDEQELVEQIVCDYAIWVGDENLLEEYRATIEERPWERCTCPICEEIGIQVAIFRGNDRNRRRGFHNTRRFYDELQAELPKTLVMTKSTASLMSSDSVETHLQEDRPDFWAATHDLPVAEIGVYEGDGFHEWWEDTPASVSFAPGKTAASLRGTLSRYERAFVHDPDGAVSRQLEATASEFDCDLHVFSSPEELRSNVLDSLGENYCVGSDFVPHPPEISVDSDLRMLIVDQCSGSKAIPSDAPVFGKDDLGGQSREELLERPNVPAIEAEDLYTGRQQEFIDDAVRNLRHQGITVERYFVSAGFGVVREDEQLPPYEVTFADMRADEVRERSARLGIPEDIERLLTQTDYDIVILALGSDYYRSIDVDEAVRLVAPDRIGVVFNRELVNRQYDNIVSVPARTDDAERHGTITVGLKGHYMKNFATRLSEVDVLEPDTISRLCREIQTTQTPLTE